MFKGILYFIRFSFQHKKSYLLARGFVELAKIAVKLTQIIMPKYVLDELFGEQRGDSILLYLGILLGISMIGGLLENILKMCADNTLEQLRCEFESYMMEHQMECDFVQLEIVDYHNLKSKASQYVNGPWNQFGIVCEKAFSLFGYVFTLLGVIYLVIRIHIVVLLVFIVMITINTWFSGRLKNKEMQLISGFAPILRRRGYYEDVAKNPTYAKEIRLYGIADWILGKYNDYMQQFCHKTIPIHRSGFYQKSVVAVTSLAQQAVTYGYLIWQVVVRAFTLGEFSMYLNAVTTFNNVMNNTVDTVLELKRYTSFYHDFQQFHMLHKDMPYGTKDAQELLDGGEGAWEIEFRNVSFCYPGQNREALKNVSVKIPLGQRISVVGENGAGKTTFIKLLTRLYDPTEGQILFCGVDIRAFNYDSYRKLFAVVFQDFQLLKSSICENIVMDQERADEERITEALHVIGFDEKIQGLKKGLDTLVYKDFDPEGIELSGGEAQKLAICRAYYKNSPICILDEPTAALDPKAECETYENFQTLVHGKTALFISHRLASSRMCDRVLVFCNGELVEDGSHTQLMKQAGLYCELFSMQAQYFNEKLAE